MNAWRGYAIAVITITVVPATYGFAADQASGTTAIESILEAWRKREKDVAAFDFEWKGQQFKGRSSFSLFPGSKGLLPSQDATFEFNVRFAVDHSGRIRKEIHSKEWSAERGKFVSKSDIDIFDGQFRKLFFPVDEATGFPNLHITGDVGAGNARDVRLLPVRLALRSFDDNFGVFRDDDIELMSEIDTIRGVPCSVLKASTGRVWVDGRRAFIPVRLTSEKNGVVNRDTGIEYEMSKEGVWIPRSWESTELAPDGAVLQSTTATVTRYVINQAIPDDAFNIDPPSGTWVRNYVTKERYIVREGGEQRPIRSYEITRTNYKKLLNTEAPPLLEDQAIGGNRWILIGANAALIVAILFLVVYRRYNRRESRNAR